MLYLTCWLIWNNRADPEVSLVASETVGREPRAHVTAVTDRIHLHFIIAPQIRILIVILKQAKDLN